MNWNNLNIAVFELCAEQMQQAKAAGTFKMERVLTSPQGTNLGMCPTLMKHLTLDGSFFWITIPHTRAIVWMLYRSIECRGKGGTGAFGMVFHWAHTHHNVCRSPPHPLSETKQKSVSKLPLGLVTHKSSLHLFVLSSYHAQGILKYRY